ncbi:MAG: glycoside hydrolase family protein [Pseudomonadota bacterium]
MKTSQTGVDLIKRFEGLELEAYEDIAGILTIGYGHTGPDVKPGMRISEQEAENILRRDLQRFERGVTSNTSVDINQNEFDALVSFSFNVGVGAYQRSTARKRLNRGDRIGAAEALTWWNKATVDGVLRPVTGLTRRRAAERALFLTPVEPASVAEPANINENSRLTPTEDPPRRGNLLESRTIQGASVAGVAGASASSMGQRDAEELDRIETQIADGEDITSIPTDSDETDTETSADPADANDGAETSDGAGSGETSDETEVEDGADEDAPPADESVTIRDNLTEVLQSSPERPSKSEQHAADAQIQFALLILIVLSVAYIVISRIDDWWNFRR